MTGLTALQDQIKQFRDYYDQAARDVGIWAELAAALPRNNSVSLKTLEVRDQGNVTCSGVARDNDAFVRVFSKLSDNTTNISNVHPEVRGQKPMQFTLSFQWQGESPMETKNREKLLMIAAAACAALWLFNLLVLSPLTNSWRGRSEEITRLKKQIAEGAMLVRRESAIRDRWDTMRSHALAGNPTAAERQLFTAFDHWVGSAGVTQGSFRPQIQETDTNFSTVDSRSDVSGSPENIRDFLKAMSLDPLANKVESFELTSKDDNGQQLTLGLSLSGLVLADPDRRRSSPRPRGGHEREHQPGRQFGVGPVPNHFAQQHLRPKPHATRFRLQASQGGNDYLPRNGDGLRGENHLGLFHWQRG